MRVAVISDIHSNLPALQAVLADIVAETPDEIWCLGDLVGYNAQPNECVDLVREHAALSLCGNHDLAVLGTIDVADFSGDAGAAARWTRTVLGEEQATWLRTLEPKTVRPGVELFHGSPRDAVWDYVLSEHVALISILETEAPVILVGHSHVALALGWDGDQLTGGLAPDGTQVELEGARWLLNPGSVGQPRDGDPRAAWLLIDIPEGRATFRRVPYPIAETQAAIRSQGLPEALAGRLEHGI
ncbi:MAG TPA: metallophosphoesterase family protein [Gaiellaceae bacterium]|jgi:diadenosine tetraphosphatase ApaH/serine/threonine PP2A family protein phosphatase|nr:metallophosphoesterase family protein [Gaiellaceae bacterium]